MVKILVVEDEQSLLWLLQAVLEELDHTVLTASNGEEALAVIEREHPKLIISDVMMPVMDGYTLLERIRQRPEWEDIKVLLISAAPINRNRKPPADEYASKPYDLDKLEDTVKSLTSE